MKRKSPNDSQLLTMLRTAILYGAALAAAAFGLQWLHYQHTVRLFATEIYIVLIACAFSGIGLWVGSRLTRKSREEFRQNRKAQAELGISNREHEVLVLVAAGNSNKDIARKLHVSPNTVKTHLAHLYNKLSVSRRTQAVEKARHLRLIP